MRHTLLPPNERKSLRFEYRMRLAVIIGLCLSAATFIGIIALFPAYIHGRIEEQVQNDAAAQLKKHSDVSGLSAIEKSLNADVAVLNNLSDVSDNIRVSSAISKVIALRGPVKILSMSDIDISSSTVSMSIRGFSPTREELLAFKGRLESQLLSGKIDLPISLLAKKTEIPFSVSLSYIYR